MTKRSLLTVIAVLVGLLLAGIVTSRVYSADNGPPDFRSRSGLSVPGVAGIEAVPAGYALVIDGESTEDGVARQVNALIIPELGVFRIELKGATDLAEMRMTVRTPEVQMGYRAQAILVGAPRPVEMAYLESLVSAPSEHWSISAKYSQEDLHISTILSRGSESAVEQKTVEADLDPQTGIIVREEQQGQHLAATIIRRIVPIEEVEVPRIDEVLSLARSDWADRFAEAEGLGFSVFGLDLPSLQPHMLQFGAGEVRLNYSGRSEPGRLALEIWQVPRDEAESLSGRFPTSWTASAADDGEPARVRTFLIGDRAIQVLLHEWALGDAVVTLDEIESSLTPLSDTVHAKTIEPPRELFDEPMPLPPGADFGGLLPEAFRMDSG